MARLEKAWQAWKGVAPHVLLRPGWGEAGLGFGMAGRA
jgi:hypothetical protein